MISHTGNMWSIYDNTDYFIFTGNSYIKNNGELVMGRGMAKQVADRFLFTPKLIGDVIKSLCDHLRFYGFATIVTAPIIGVFQVKKHYKMSAELSIIEKSVSKLKVFADKYSDKRFDMNYPGIGYGGLCKRDVAPLLERLPDNVHIWSFVE